MVGIKKIIFHHFIDISIIIIIMFFKLLPQQSHEVFEKGYYSGDLVCQRGYYPGDLICKEEDPLL